MSETLIPIKHPELSMVTLNRPIKTAGVYGNVTVPSGTEGVVVHVFCGEVAYLVEFKHPHVVVTVKADRIAD